MKLVTHCKMKKNIMDDNAVMGMFVGFLLLIFLLYQYLSWNSSLLDDNHGVLMNVETQPQHIRGIDLEQRVVCPREAQLLLQRWVKKRDLRGVIYRDGSAWVVSAGKQLSVVPAHGSQPGVTVYYMRQNPPDITDDGNETSMVPKELEGLVAMHNSAINPAALNGTPGAAVTRYNSMAEALAAWPSTDGADEITYLYFNGPNDPVYYVVRTKKGIANGIISIPSLPGTVYARR